jgi:hypothetical protein
MVKRLLKLESLFVFLAATYIFAIISAQWLTFILLFLSPDITMLGYLLNKKAGAFLYNIVHNYAFTIILLLIGQLANNTSLIELALIFTAHIGLDRSLGLGLKYPDSFKHTHLQKV